MKYRFVGAILTHEGIRQLHDTYLRHYNPRYMSLFRNRIISVVLHIDNDEDLAFLKLALPVKIEEYDMFDYTPSSYLPIDEFLEQL